METQQCGVRVDGFLKGDITHDLFNPGQSGNGGMVTWDTDSHYTHALNSAVQLGAFMAFEDLAAVNIA
jgi:hypothetical protein